MAEELVVRIISDLSKWRGVRCDADVRRTIALDGLAYELDLTGEESAELDAALETFIGAATPAAELHSCIYLTGDAVPTGTREYNASMRAWGDKNDLGDGIGYRKNKGGYYHSKPLKDRYADFLRGASAGRSTSD